MAPTLLPGWPPVVQPFHWIVYDKSGKSLVIEPIERQARRHRQPDRRAHQLAALRLAHDQPAQLHRAEAARRAAGEARRQDVAGFGMGSGMLGLPGDFTPPSRFVRAAVFSRHRLPESPSEGRHLQRLPHPQQLRHPLRRRARRRAGRRPRRPDDLHDHARSAEPAHVLQELRRPDDPHGRPQALRSRRQGGHAPADRVGHAAGGRHVGQVPRQEDRPADRGREPRRLSRRRAS